MLSITMRPTSDLLFASFTAFSIKFSCSSKLYGSENRMFVAKNILFSEPYSFEEQENLIEKAVKLANSKSEVGLIVIDSITMHYRLTMRDETRREERYGLTRQIAKLLRASRERGIPVVVTSQVYTDIETGAYLPLGGHMLSHNAKTIIRFERSGTSARTAVLEKHRHREEGTRATFRITGQGLED